MQSSPMSSAAISGSSQHIHTTCRQIIWCRMSWWRVILANCRGPSSTLGQACFHRHFTSSRCSHDVRRNIEGRFFKPASANLGIPGAAAEEAAFAEIAPEINLSPTRRRIATFFQLFLPITGSACLIYAFTHPDDEPLIPKKLPPELQYLAAQKHVNEEVLTNWSATHQVQPKRIFQPETESEVDAFLRQASKAGQKLRVMGSGLSPNGLGFCDEGVLSMALMDKVISVDVNKKQVTVQPGIRVQQLTEALAPYGLTLQNFASIKEQQVGGFTQVGAHGTGARVPSVEEQVVSMRLATPGLGTLNLSADSEPELFKLAKVGLGALGVITQLTLQCVPRHRLVERTFTTTISDVKKNHVKWLQNNQHLRYMWIPYTDTVVVVQCNPEGSAAAIESQAAAAKQTAVDEATRVAPLRELLTSRVGPSIDITSYTFTQLRDELLALAPTDKDWVARVNGAEAEAWKRSAGLRSGWSDEILGFDCGGQQWVHEVCFPVGQLSELKGSTKDIQYMEALLKEIKNNKIPAAAPIEQRWSSGSSADMSPGAGPAGLVNSWVGIIMYLPQDQHARDAVTNTFRDYAQLVQAKLGPKFNAATHWAKLEPPPAGSSELSQLRNRLAARYPLDKFNAYRQALDPHNILANSWVDALLTSP